MPKKRTKEEQREYQAAYRARRVTPSVTPDQDVTPGREVLQVHQAERVPLLAHVDPSSPMMSPYRFVPSWVAHNKGAPSNDANQAWLDHLANTLALTGRTPQENAASLRQEAGSRLRQQAQKAA